MGHSVAMIGAMRREISKRASACVRNYAAGAGKPKASGETTDVVKRVFIEQQTKFRALLTKTKDLKPPVGGDAAAVKAYAAKKLAALKELDETEKALGKALLTSDAQGMAKYSSAVAKASEAAGIKPLDAAAMAKLQGEVDLESIENEILELQSVEDEVKKEEA